MPEEKKVEERYTNQPTNGGTHFCLTKNCLIFGNYCFDIFLLLLLLQKSYTFRKYAIDALTNRCIELCIPDTFGGIKLYFAQNNTNLVNNQTTTDFFFSFL